MRSSSSGRNIFSLENLSSCARASGTTLWQGLRDDFPGKDMRPFPVAAVLILAGMLAGCHGEAKMYSATAEIEVTIPDYMGDFGIRPNSFLPGQIKIMQYPEMLMPVITKLNLDQKWAARFGTGRAVMPAEEALQHLKKNLAIEVVKGANILKITAQSEAPQEAADIANGVADQYKIFRDRLAAEELK